MINQGAAEFRKVIAGAPIPELPAEFCAAGGAALVLPEKFGVRFRVAFWIPQKPPYRRCSGKTEVGDVKPFELEALRAGVIAEEVHELTFPEMPSVDEMRRRLFPVWEGLTRATVGELRDVPVDLKPNPSMSIGLVGIRADSE